MAKKGNRDRRNGVSNESHRGQRQEGKLTVRVLPEDGSHRVRLIDELHIRYYFTRSAWLNGVITRKWITKLFPDGSGGVMDWRDVPIHRDGIYVRSEEGVFRLEGARSLEDVKKMIGGGLLRPHESVLIRKEWIHDYSAVHAEIGVLVEGPDGKSQSERIQVSTRYKKTVEKWIFSRSRRRALPPSATSPPVSPADC